ETVAMCKIAAYLFPQLKVVELYQVGGFQVYLPCLLVGLATVAVITFINYRGVLQSTAFQNVTTFGLLAIFCVFAPLGLGRGNVTNLSPLFANQDSSWPSVLSVLMILQIMPYYLTGFETIPKCAEEAAADFPPRRFLPVMLLALGVATVFYVSVPGVVALLWPWQKLV